MINPCWFCRKINESGSNSRVVPYHASRFGRSSSVGSNRSRYRVLIALLAPSAATIRSASANSLTSSYPAVELEADAGLAAVTLQRTKQIDPSHAMEGVAGERDVLALVHDLHVVEDHLSGGDGLVDFRGDLANECERDVGEHQAPAVGRAFRIALVDADIVPRVSASHQVREEQSCRPSANDPDLHGFARASLNWETLRRICP